MRARAATPRGSPGPERTKQVEGSIGMTWAGILARVVTAGGAEQAIEFGNRDRAAKRRKRPRSRDFLGRAEKARPCRSRERAADADTAHANLRELRHGGEVTTDQHVHGCWRNRANNRGDAVEGTHTWRVQAVSAGFGVGDQTGDRLCEIRPSGDEAFGAAGQQHAASAVIDRA